MKEQFKAAMRYLYPEGHIATRQLRDLVYTFSMGWCSALERLAGPEARDAWTREHAYMKDLNWWPDDSWIWWERRPGEPKV